jgi:hypothetical protein
LKNGVGCIFDYISDDRNNILAENQLGENDLKIEENRQKVKILTYWSNGRQSKYCLDFGHTFDNITYHGSLSSLNSYYHGLGFLIDSKNDYSYIGNFDNGRREGFGKMQT